MSLNNKVIAITGAGGVLCRALAAAFLTEGATVALLDHNPNALQAAKEALGGGKAVHTFLCDVLDAAACDAVAKAVNDTTGPVSVLLNGAGGNHPLATTDDEFFKPETNGRSFFDLTAADFSRTLSLNVLGTLLPTQAFARQMVGRAGCSVLNISSMNAYRPLTKIPAYSAGKAAVSNLTAWLAVHFSKVGIRVNAIAPGFFDAGQNHKLLWEEDGTPTARTKKILAATPMGRFGTPDELCSAATFLCDSERAAFITGVVLPIDGGFSAYAGV